MQRQKPLGRPVSHVLAPRDFDEQLHEQLRKAPWLIASVALHGVVAVVFLMLPHAVRVEQVATRITATPAGDPPIVLPPEDPPEIQPAAQQDIERPDRTRDEIDAPVTDKVDENPGDDDEEDVPTGDPFAQTFTGIEGTGPNTTIGLGGGVGGPWGLRGKGGRNGGGDGARKSPVQIVVDHGLEWLARHQSPDGRWDCDGFSAQCRTNRCGGPGESTHDPGVTGLALLCFLGRGDTHQSGEHKGAVKSALRYLKGIQDTEGCFGPRTSGQFQYDHAISTLAVVEAYGLTQSLLVKDAAQRGVDFIHQSRNPYLAWRYGIRDGDNDTSVTGWMVMALKSAKLAELNVEDGAIRDAVSFVDRMTEPEFGKVGYQQRGGPCARTTAAAQRFPADRSESLTAAGVLCRIFGGEDPAKSEIVKKGLDLVSKKLPVWDPDGGSIDMYYWYYGTLATFQAGGEPWRKWNAAMKTAIVDHQRAEADRCEEGSWDPEGPWAPEGGRVYSTALMTLCLEVYYRYPRVFGTGAR